MHKYNYLYNGYFMRILLASCSLRVIIVGFLQDKCTCLHLATSVKSRQEQLFVTSCFVC